MLVIVLNLKSERWRDMYLPTPFDIDVFYAGCETKMHMEHALKRHYFKQLQEACARKDYVETQYWFTLHESLNEYPFIDTSHLKAWEHIRLNKRW